MGSRVARNSLPEAQGVAGLDPLRCSEAQDGSLIGFDLGGREVSQPLLHPAVTWFGMGPSGMSQGAAPPSSPTLQQKQRTDIVRQCRGRREAQARRKDTGRR